MRIFITRLIISVSFLASILLTACSNCGTTGSVCNSSGLGVAPPATSYTIGGTLSGLASGNQIIIADNGVDNTILSANGTFTFPTPLANGSAYSIAIITLPTNQPCTYTYGAGIVAGANVTSINIICGPAVAGVWSPANPMITAPAGRESHTATLLSDGTVLVAGGLTDPAAPAVLSTSELYDPSTNTWTATAGSLATARDFHTATLLPNGMVLVAGGQDGNSSIASAELYNPSTGIWSSAGTMNTSRYNHTATLLPNGKVLVAGGWNGSVSSPTALNTAELYNPATNSWTPAGNLASARAYHTATLLPNGQVLVAGGFPIPPSTTPNASAELYDPAKNTWAAAGSLANGRMEHTATLLPTGKVLVAGGFGTAYLVSAELYDPVANTWSSGGNLNAARNWHTATLLPTGQVLVAGGFGTTNFPIASTELYNPTLNSWASTGILSTPRTWHTA
ncbi:MAG: kelch repeat-containing protein, partial [Gallionella sp.]